MTNYPFTTNDQLGRTVHLERPPERIVSIVPSQTELLFDLDLADQVVGVTRYCVHPAGEVKEKTQVGGTKKIYHQRVIDLEPDLIIANKEENRREDVEKLCEVCPVWISDVDDLPSSLDMIRQVGEITHRRTQGMKMAAEIERSFRELPSMDSQSVLYLIWKNPYMAVGSDTFIHRILERWGLVNVCGHLTRYPTLEEGDLTSLKADLILLSSEPFPFDESHIDEISDLAGTSRIFLVDGEMFSWYGPRLLKTVSYLKGLGDEINEGSR